MNSLPTPPRPGGFASVPHQQRRAEEAVEGVSEPG
jgi:hypothetical protein